MELSFAQRYYLSIKIFKDNFFKSFIYIFFISLFAFLLQNIFIFLYKKYEILPTLNNNIIDETFRFYQYFYTYTSENLILIIIATFVALIYIFASMLFWVFIYKTVVNILKWEDISVKIAFNYVVWKIKDISIFYYYIFIYTFWFLSWIIIFFWLFYLILNYLWYDIIAMALFVIWYLFALIYFIVKVIKKIIKTTISLIWAVYEDDFSKNNFNYTLKITDNKVLNLFWNLLLLWIISTVILFIYSTFLYFTWIDVNYKIYSNNFNIFAIIEFIINLIFWYINTIFLVSYYEKLKNV